LSSSSEQNSSASAAQLAKCILLYTYSHITASSQLRENKQKLSIAYQQAGITVFLVIN